MKSIFWVNNVYSLGYYLKDYGYYPKILPLFSYMDHGMTGDLIYPHEIENKAPLMFKFQNRLIGKYNKLTDKPVYCVLNPTIHYRIKKNIKLSNCANGTLFFIAHSTPNIDDHTEWEKFIDKLKEIPEDFHPVDICLHYHDINKGLSEIFEKKGYKVLTAGSPDNRKFVRNFYNILSNYKFTMSNIFGSYAYYSVELGIPFSLFGNGPEYKNVGDSNYRQNEELNYIDQSQYKITFNLFRGFHKVCTPNQIEFVNGELGKFNSISRKQTARLLYSALLKFSLRYPHIFLYSFTVFPILQLFRRNKQ